MKNSYILKIYDEVFRTEINFFIDHSFDELNDELRKRFDLELDEENKYSLAISAKLEKEGRPCFMIWFPKFEWTIEYQGRVAHELLHSIFQITEHIGIELHEKSGEVFCYLFQYYFTKLLVCLNKHKIICLPKKKS